MVSLSAFAALPRTAPRLHSDLATAASSRNAGSVSKARFFPLGVSLGKPVFSSVVLSPTSGNSQCLAPSSCRQLTGLGFI